MRKSIFDLKFTLKIKLIEETRVTIPSQGPHGLTFHHEGPLVRQHTDYTFASLGRGPYEGTICVGMLKAGMPGRSECCMVRLLEGDPC